MKRDPVSFIVAVLAIASLSIAALTGRQVPRAAPNENGSRQLLNSPLTKSALI